MVRLTMLSICLMAAALSSAQANEAMELLDRWRGCLLDKAILFGAGTDEAAGVVARGAFGACEPDENRYLTEVYRHSGPALISDYSRIIGDTRSAQEDWVIAQVMAARMRAKHYDRDVTE